MSRSLYFFLFQRKLYILFSISFLIFWNSINLAYVSQLGNKDLVSDHIFTSQRGLTLFQTWVFCWPSIILFHLELSRINLPKLTSNILMEIVAIPAALVDEFCFYMHYPIKVWLFEKIFELVYLFHIVLKSLISY